MFCSHIYSFLHSFFCTNFLWQNTDWCAARRWSRSGSCLRYAPRCAVSVRFGDKTRTLSLVTTKSCEVAGQPDLFRERLKKHLEVLNWCGIGKHSLYSQGKRNLNCFLPLAVSYRCALVCWPTNLKSFRPNDPAVWHIWSNVGGGAQNVKYWQTHTISPRLWRLSWAWYEVASAISLPFSRHVGITVWCELYYFGCESGCNVALSCNVILNPAGIFLLTKLLMGWTIGGVIRRTVRSCEISFPGDP